MRNSDEPLALLRSMLTFLFLCALPALFSCGDDDSEATFDYPLEGTVYSMTDIADTWLAVEATFEDPDNASNSIDIIAEGGSAVLTIQENGRFTFSATVPGTPGWTFTGQMGFSGNALVLLIDGDEPGEDELFFSIHFINEMLNIGGPAEFDITGDGVDEEVFIDLLMERS